MHKNKATKHSPFQILFGRSPRTPIDFARENIIQAINEAGATTTPSASQWAARWDRARQKLWDFVRRNQLKIATDMKRRYDRGRKPLHLEPGDMVLLSTQSHAILTGIRKHREKYVGPYIVDSRIHDMLTHYVDSLLVYLLPKTSVSYDSFYLPPPDLPHDLIRNMLNQ